MSRTCRLHRKWLRFSFRSKQTPANPTQRERAESKFQMIHAQPQQIRGSRNLCVLFSENPIRLQKENESPVEWLCGSGILFDGLRQVTMACKTRPRLFGKLQFTGPTCRLRRP